MATSKLTKNVLKITYEAGMNEETQKEIYKTQSFSRVELDSTDEQLRAVGQAFGDCIATGLVKSISKEEHYSLEA